jgi:serine/threonine protein kinase
MNDFPLVSLLIENKADVIKPYDGPSMYKGWVKPGQTLVQCVVNRKGRFVGTMLADKLTKIEEALLAAIPVQSQQQEAEKKDVGATDAKEFELVEEVVEESVVTEMDGEPVRRKSVAVKVAGGCTMRHTQGHPKDVFEISDHLGDGDRSSVWLGFHRETKAPVAIKTEQKTSTAIEAWVWEEINLMRKVEHPNIAQLYETFECEKQIYMVLELCEGGRLFENCTREQCLAVMKSPKLMKQAAMAVDFLHSRNFAHRDIQLDNFLLADNAAFPEGNCKLIDFTTSKKFGPDDPLKTKICTPGYVAKEILTRKMDPYTEKVDVWSLGVVFFIMLSGAPPFAGADDMETLKKVKKGVYKFEPADRWSPVPEEAKQLVTGMINVKVEERLSATGVLAHPFLANA